MSRIDITGQRYGRLTVLEEVEPVGYTRRWKCKCECGKEIIARMPNLRSGHTTSCGCVQKERTSEVNADDLTGKTFGRLTVIRRARNKRESRHIFWECLCDCGRTIDVDGVRLRDGSTQSCGCLRTDAGKTVQQYNESNLRVDGVMTHSLKRKVRSDSTTGVKGVSRKLTKNGAEVYEANITIAGKRIYLGTYPNLSQAATARKAAEEKYHKPYIERLKEDEK